MNQHYINRTVVVVLTMACFQISEGFAQASPGIWVIDLVRIKPGKEKEALYFYENNWLVFREAAKKEGYIKSFRLIRTGKQDVPQFDLMLMTEFPDSASFKKMEENFGIVMRARPGGARFLNELRPRDFMEFVNSIEGTDLAAKQ